MEVDSKPLTLREWHDIQLSATYIQLSRLRLTQYIACLGWHMIKANSVPACKEIKMILFELP